MNGRKLAAYGFTTLLAAALLVGITPTASAQAGEQPLNLIPKSGTPTLNEACTVGLRAGRLPPETGKICFKFEFSVQVPAVVGSTVCPITPITVTFTLVNENAWANPTLSTTAVTKNTDPSKNTATQEITGFDTVLTIIITKDAPAFKTGTFKVEAIASAGQGSTSSGCGFSDSPKYSVPAQSVNDYLPILEYAPLKYIQKTGQNKDVIFGIKMTNFGNGETRVTTTTAPGKKALDALTPPSPVTLDSRAERGKDAKYIRDDVLIQARTPHSNGYTNSIYTFTATFKATSTIAAADVLEDSQFVTLSVQVQGVYVPGFDPTSAIAALGVALLGLGIARRRA